MHRASLKTPSQRQEAVRPVATPRADEEDGGMEVTPQQQEAQVQSDAVAGTDDAAMQEATEAEAPSAAAAEE